MLSAEKQVKLFMYAMYLLALIVGCGIGVAFVWKSYGQTRETRLEIFNNDIVDWNTTKRAEFDGQKFYIQTVKADGSKAQSTSYLDEKTDESVEHKLDEDKYGALPYYEPLYYSLRTDASTFGVDTYQTFNYSDTIQFNILIGEGTDQQTVILPKVKLYYIDSFRMYNSAGWDKLHGHYEATGQMWYQYYALSHLCVQMDKDEGGNWFMNRNKVSGNYGCYSRNHNSTKYDQIELGIGQQIEDVFPYTFSKLTWEVRSAYDPWLLSMILTEDTKDFGMSTFELRMIGFGLLFWWGGLTIQPTCWILSKFKSSREISKEAQRQGPYMYDPEFDDYEAPTGNYNRNAPASATIEPSADKGLELQNELEDLDLARVRPGPLNLSGARGNKRVKRKGEYESYYN